ncbi:uncharacterized protein LOC126898646 isoform X2 [Daktulosphaira vitifoliae]|uniref:uncharacterized protein LOC126898646 isoform X2 n=1 Tax=Daktulosphaira vitifoliae TaxID=58002 RepID=UPI0021A97A58|nr:uncharacterized protein LOC126898646 isoform X2 [Daktulosphaira vitifoliae]
MLTDLNSSSLILNSRYVSTMYWLFNIFTLILIIQTYADDNNENCTLKQSKLALQKCMVLYDISIENENILEAKLEKLSCLLLKMKNKKEAIKLTRLEIIKVACKNRLSNINYEKCTSLMNECSHRFFDIIINYANYDYDEILLNTIGNITNKEGKLLQICEKKVDLTKEEMDIDTLFDKRSKLSKCLYENFHLRSYDVYEDLIQDISNYICLILKLKNKKQAKQDVQKGIFNIIFQIKQLKENVKGNDLISCKMQIEKCVKLFRKDLLGIHKFYSRPMNYFVDELGDIINSREEKVLICHQ